MPGFGTITWLIGYTFASIVAAVMSVRVFEFAASPFFKKKSRVKQVRSSSSSHGQERQ